MSHNQFNVGEKARHFIIADVAKENPNFRKVLWTGEHSQLVVMTVPAGGEIGDEVHDSTDQLLTFVSGTGEAVLDGHTHTVDAGDLCAVPAGTRHNFRNTGTEPLVLHTVYSPPEHAVDAEYTTKERADAAEDAGMDEPPGGDGVKGLDGNDKEQTMTRTLVFTAHGGPETQEIIEQPAPVPGPGQIAIEVRAAGVNPVDWKIRAGRLGDLPLPAPMGREASGVVTAVGAGVEDFAVGDEVLGLAAPGHGTFATHTVLDADQAVAKPEELSFEDAAALPVAGATAYDVTHQIELEPGQTMLVLGAGGGVGLMAAQIGRVHEFTVIGVASASKQEPVESTGATFVASGDGAADRVRALVPDGVDLVIDLVGGQALRDIAGVAKEPGLVITAADPATAEELGGTAVQRSAEGLEKITGVAEYGLVDPQVSARFSLDDVHEAVAAVETGHAAGKVIVVP